MEQTAWNTPPSRVIEADESATEELNEAPEHDMEEYSKCTQAVVKLALSELERTQSLNRKLLNMLAKKGD